MKSFMLEGTHIANSLSMSVALLALSLSVGTFVFTPESHQGRPLGWTHDPARDLLQSSNRPTGQIRGVVRIESRIKSKSMAFRIYSRGSSSLPPGSPAPVVDEVENVVLYLERDFPSSPPSKGYLPGDRGGSATGGDPTHGRLNPSVRQINETFVPHVLPIMTGTTVEFPNGDPFFHNVFSLSSTKNFDLGRYPQGQIRTVRFDKPGIVKVFCHIHSNMSAVILVFNHPFFTVPDSRGQFFLPAVPAGSYTLVGWHERLKTVKRPVTVKAEETLAVDVVL
jgi:plastocyanin